MRQISEQRGKFRLQLLVILSRPPTHCSDASLQISEESCKYLPDHRGIPTLDLEKFFFLGTKGILRRPQSVYSYELGFRQYQLGGSCNICFHAGISG